jgi:two-component system sensor histidine kinase HydH
MNEDPEVKQRYARDLGYMISEIDRLNSSVQQLLAFSRPAPEVKADINLTRLLETTTEMLSRVQVSDGVVLRCRAGPGLTLQRSNPELLQQTVLNLILNAVQASKAGQLVEIEAEPKASDKVTIRITDEGPGIPKEVRERIFEPFFTTKQQGTGLGLAIVRKNVRQMGGEIEVESPVENERGTRVTLTLPVS